MNSKFFIAFVRFLTPAWVLLLPTTSIAPPAAFARGEAPEGSYYDEIYDENHEVRPQYQEILPIYQKLGARKQAQFLKDSKRDFRGDNAMDSLPRVLSESEYDVLKRGTEQRGNAIRLFLQDYYAGNLSAIESIIPKAVLDRIVQRSHEGPYLGHVRPESIAFPYGPDIIRDASGAWRVVEDNPGSIGGVGDLKIAREILMKRIAAYAKKIQPLDRPDDFYDGLIARYRSLRNPPKGAIVLYALPPYPDHEDDRVKKLFASRGVEIITPYTAKKLVSNSRGVFIEQKGPKGTILRKRVGFVIFNHEHADADSRDPLALEKAAFDEARLQLSYPDLAKPARKAITAALVPDPVTGKVDLDRLREAFLLSNYEVKTHKSRLQAPGLIEAMVSGKVATNYSPGVDFIGDKEFYLYVDDLVRHYLHEEPILKNIPTYRFSKTGPDGAVKLDSKVLDRVFANPEKYVIKAVDGRGGDAVWVGAKIPAREFAKVRSKILANPEQFIVQEFTHLSVMDGKIVDLRMISAVDQDGVFVSPTPWSRALPLDGDGKVNLSSSGRELAVLVKRDSSKRARRRIASEAACVADGIRSWKNQ